MARFRVVVSQTIVSITTVEVEASDKLEAAGIGLDRSEAEHFPEWTAFSDKLAIVSVEPEGV